MDRTNTRNWWIGGAVVVIVLLGIFYYMSNAAQAKGTVYMTVSDASADIQNVDDVSMTVSKVELHSTTGAWVTVSDSPSTFKLMTLKANGKAELAGKADVPAGTYDQVRATVSDVSVKNKDGSTHSAVLGAHSFTLMANTVVREGQSSRANIDVNTADSMHTATGGQYVFAPVMHFQSRDNAEVTVNSDNTVTTTGGTADGDVMVGTDLQGMSHINAALSPNVQIQINGSMPVMLNASGSASGSGSTSGSSNASGSSMGTVSGLVQIDASGMLTNTAATNDTNANTNTNANANANGSTNSGTNGSTGTSNSNTSGSANGSAGVNTNGSVNVNY